MKTKMGTSYQETISIKEYLSRRGISFKESGRELQTFCFFNDCDRGKQDLSSGHLYLNNEKQIYFCHKCNSEGNIFDLARHFGDDVKNIYKYPLAKTISPEVVAELEKEIEELHASVELAKDWLIARGFTEETINKFKLGYSAFNNSVSIPHYQSEKPVSIKFRLLDWIKGGEIEKFIRKPGTPSVLFNADAIEGVDEVTIVEGEFDAIMGVQEGVKNIVAITGGAKTFKEEWVGFFDKFKKIYLCLDSDIKGQEGALNIADKLGLDRCFNVVLPTKDINDFFLNGHKQEELKILFASARQFPGARTIVSVNEILKMTPKDQPFILDGMLVENSVNALTSDSGKGKSLLMLKMVEAIVGGEKFLGEFDTKKTKTLILDLEMSENDIIQRTQSIIHRELDGLDFYHCQSFNICDDKDFDWIKKKIIENGYKLVVLDTFSMAHNKNENDNTETNIVNRKLLELVNDCGITILFLHHHRKLTKGENYSQASSRGATDIIGKTASHLLLDSRDIIVAIGEGTKIGLKGIRLIVEQMKRRQFKGCERFAVKVWYNPDTKKTSFEFDGFDEKAETALEKTKNLISSSMKDGEEYIMSQIKEIVGKSSNIYTAIKELSNEGVIAIRELEEGEAKEKKLKANAKIYSLSVL